MLILDRKEVFSSGVIFNFAADPTNSHAYTIARLKLLFIAAKVVKDGDSDKVKYSIHDARTPAMFYLLQFLDEVRSRPRPWHQDGIWPASFVN